MQKQTTLRLLCCCVFSAALFGKNPQPKNVEIEYRGSYQKPEFLTQYDKLVGTKEVKKIVANQKPLKLLNHEFLNKWKLAGNLLVTAVKDDANLATQTGPKIKGTVEDLVANLNSVIKDLYQQASMLIEQKTIAFYKKPLFRSKPKYDDAEILAARRAIKNTLTSEKPRSLSKIRSEAASIQFDLRVIKDYANLTDGEKNICAYAAEFGNFIADLADNLEQEIKTIE